METFHENANHDKQKDSYKSNIIYIILSLWYFFFQSVPHVCTVDPDL